MGNTVSSSSLSDAALNLADGNTAVKKNLSVTGTSNFTGDATLRNAKIDGNLNVTNGKFIAGTNSYDIGSMDTRLSTVETNTSGVSTGSFGANNVTTSGNVTAANITSTGTGQFSTINIDGDITSTSRTGRKYIEGKTTGTGTDATYSLSLTNGYPVGTTTNYNKINLDSGGDISITVPTGKKVNINNSTAIDANGNITAGTSTAPSNIRASGSVSGNSIKVNTVATDIITSDGSINAVGRITANSGMNVSGTAMFNDTGTAIVAAGQITANKGVVVGEGSNLTVTGTSTLTGATNATGLITANGGVTVGSGILTVSGLTNASGKMTLNGGLEIAQGNFIARGSSSFVGSTIMNGTMDAVKNVSLGAQANLSVGGTTTLTGATTATGKISANGGISIGTGKWAIDEIVDANKGTRLCFGKNDGQRTTYFTCMNSAGNLELF